MAQRIKDAISPVVNPSNGDYTELKELISYLEDLFIFTPEKREAVNVEFSLTVKKFTTLNNLMIYLSLNNDDSIDRAFQNVPMFKKLVDSYDEIEMNLRSILMKHFHRIWIQKIKVYEKNTPTLKEGVFHKTDPMFVKYLVATSTYYKILTYIFCSKAETCSFSIQALAFAVKVKLPEILKEYKTYDALCLFKGLENQTNLKPKFYLLYCLFNNQEELLRLMNERYEAMVKRREMTPSAFCFYYSDMVTKTWNPSFPESLEEYIQKLDVNGLTPEINSFMDAECKELQRARWI